MQILTLEQARRVAVRGQLLDAERPADLVVTVERLTFRAGSATTCCRSSTAIG